MNINLQQIDVSNFNLITGVIGQETCVLVNPNHIGTQWNKDTLHFRSSVWKVFVSGMSGALISASFPKFFNLGEKPDIYPNPEKFKDWNIIEKIDGSTLIVSKYNNELIHRTRGTFDASNLENGYEIETLKQKYPNVFKSIDENYSYIYEWVTPNNQIVIKYTEPELYLIGIINHSNYNLTNQKSLDEFAKALGVKRPKRYQFDNLTQMVETVSQFRGQEGICLYYNNDQNIVKVKGEWYLKCHRLRSELGPIDRVIDLYFSTGSLMDYVAFYEYVVNNFDYEIAEQIKGQLSEICDGMKEVSKIINYMKSFVNPLKLKSRKEAANEILASYGSTNRSGMAFTVLDGKELSLEQIKKLLYQVLKKIGPI